MWWWLPCGIPWLAAWELSAASVVQGLYRRKIRTVLKGVIALGIAFLNFFNLPHGGRTDHFSVAMLRNINTAEVTYLSDSGGAYGEIADLVRHDLLDSRFEQSEIRHYVIKMDLSPKEYVITASPTGPYSPAEGCWEYFSTEDALIRYSKDPEKAPPGFAGRPVDR
jgi:hypothetical protein